MCWERREIERKSMQGECPTYTSLLILFPGIFKEGWIWKERKDFHFPNKNSLGLFSLFAFLCHLFYNCVFLGFRDCLYLLPLKVQSSHPFLVCFLSHILSPWWDAENPNVVILFFFFCFSFSPMLRLYFWRRSFLGATLVFLIRDGFLNILSTPISVILFGSGLIVPRMDRMWSG